MVQCIGIVRLLIYQKEKAGACALGQSLVKEHGAVAEVLEWSSHL